MIASSAQHAASPGHNPWLIAIVVTMATFMEVLDTSIANVALPHIAGNLSAGIDESTWVLTSYLVANAIILPLSGWMSTIIGRKRFYMACVALFTLSSFLCGLAPTLGTLVVFRILQGLGGGGLQPSEQSILVDTFPQEKRGMAFATYGVAVVVAPVIGPTLGGWITDNFTWRWIFFINIPIGLLSLFFTSILIHDPPHLKEERQRRAREGFHIDWTGLGLIAVGLGCLQVMLDKGQREDWFQSTFIVAMAIICVVALVGGIIWECCFAKDPVVELSLLKERNFAMANILMFTLGFVLLGSTVMIPIFTQSLLGYTAELAGLVISPGGIAVMLLMPIVGFLLQKRFDPRIMIAMGLAVSGYGLIRMTHFDTQVSFSTVLWARVVQASGLALLFVPINTIAYAYVPPQKNNAASGLINLQRNIGGSVGIALATTLLARQQQVNQSYLVAHATPYDPAYRRALSAISQHFIAQGASAADAMHRALAAIYAQVQQQASMLAFLDVFRLLSIFFFLAIPLAFLMKRPKAGAAVAMH